IDVRLVADRHRAREAETVVLEQQPYLEQDVAALGDEADRPCRERSRGELELRGAVDDTEAVGPHERRAGGTDTVDERALPRRAVLPQLGEPGRDGDESARTYRERGVHGLLEP